jgi:phosphoribosylformimino-5-aminoimidazole carboxamide ribonucleotide (ProFAR) isomerase
VYVTRVQKRSCSKGWGSRLQRGGGGQHNDEITADSRWWWMLMVVGRVPKRRKTKVGLLTGDDSDVDGVVLSVDPVEGRGAAEGWAALTNVDADKVESWRTSASWAKACVMRGLDVW